MLSRGWLALVLEAYQLSSIDSWIMRTEVGTGIEEDLCFLGSSGGDNHRVNVPAAAASAAEGSLLAHFLVNLLLEKYGR